MKVCCWNIRRGLLKREHEIKNLLTEEDLDVLFLVETDTYAILEEGDYKVTGYKTVFPLKEEKNQKTRIVALIVEENKNIKIRQDLMDEKFPSIWLEEERVNESNLLMCGFYREWTQDGERKMKTQIDSIKLFNLQLEKASKENKMVIVQGDANLCSNKWLEEGFGLREVSNELLSSLAMCGLEIMEVGNTYLADRLTADGSTIQSALDHTYVNTATKSRSSVSKLDFGSTDHLPILAKVGYRKKPKKQHYLKLQKEV